MKATTQLPTTSFSSAQTVQQLLALAVGAGVTGGVRSFVPMYGHHLTNFLDFSISPVHFFFIAVISFEGRASLWHEDED